MSCYEVLSKKQWERSPSYLSPSNLEIADMDSQEEGERGPVPTAATLCAGVPGTVSKDCRYQLRPSASVRHLEEQTQRI